MDHTYRYVVNAVGKGGETYYSHFKDKHDLKKWIIDHQDKLLMDELKVVDKHRSPLLKWLPFKI
ncbi:hypothetical protein QYG89_02670 [Bacillus sp. B190/17]|uniref:Uncharacterized protein n=1 Tax=Bacillus lumedeiriae TaxID=3058829 RepID=A0ABW8I596_9BACI